MKKQYALILIAMLMFTVAISAVYARAPAGDNGDEICIPKPATAFSVAMVTESVVYLFTGGMGPILILALVAILAAIVSHLIWGGF
jgi:hypothetical protein